MCTPDSTVVKRKINFHRTRYHENTSLWTALLQLLCKRERKVYWISILYLSRKSASCSSYSHLWPSCNQVLHASDFITSIPLRIGSKLHCSLSLSLDEKYNIVCLLTIRYSRKTKIVIWAGNIYNWEAWPSEIISRLKPNHCC